MSQTVCQRDFLVPMRWRPVGGGLSRPNRADNRADRPLIRSTQPPGGPLHASSLMHTPIQVAFRQYRARLHGQREHKSP